MSLAHGLNAGRDNSGGVDVEADGGASEQLEVSDGGSVCAGDEGLAVHLKTLLHNVEHFLPVSFVSPLSASLVGEGLAQNAGEEVSVEPVHCVLTEVDHGVDGVDGLGVFRVVAKSDAESAKDTV